MNKARSYNRFRESWRARHEPGAIRMLSIFYWRTLISFALLLFVFMLGWGWWEMKTTLAAFDKLNETQPNQAPIITRKDVDNVVTSFSARQSTYDELKLHPLSVADPSQ